jgi:2-oxoglutarate dehydrogenase E2 component (dihydrolipoamide succinyltransferase)
MISRRVLVAAKFVQLYPTLQFRYPLAVHQFQFRSYADKIVKVPEMAESISEGTLKQWSKQIGDFVEQDEEIATIETDKVQIALHMYTRSDSLILLQIDVAVNAPEAGTIKEFLANEEDTVVVGQDLVKLELGGSPKVGDKESATSEPKEAASSDQHASSEHETRKDHSPPSPAPEAKQGSPRAQDQPKKESPPKKEDKPASKNESKSINSAPALGSREERRVRITSSTGWLMTDGY